MSEHPSARLSRARIEAKQTELARCAKAAGEA
jgi:hypothetical protein